MSLRNQETIDVQPVLETVYGMFVWNLGAKTARHGDLSRNGGTEAATAGGFLLLVFLKEGSANS